MKVDTLPKQIAFAIAMIVLVAAQISVSYDNYVESRDRRRQDVKDMILIEDSIHNLEKASKTLDDIDKMLKEDGR